MKPIAIKFPGIIAGILLLSLPLAPLHAQAVKDFDGKTYTTTKIGQQEWMTENLSVIHFKNGDPVPQAKTPEEWTSAAKTGQPAWCYYNNSDSIGKIYGILYNWYAITDPRGLAPEGWHIPTNADWIAISKFLGGVDVAGLKMKNINAWDKLSYANNKSGFNALPGGMRDDKGKFTDLHRIGQWWSASKSIRIPTQIYSVRLQEALVEVFYETKDVSYGLSVRAVKD